MESVSTVVCQCHRVLEVAPSRPIKHAQSPATAAKKTTTFQLLLTQIAACQHSIAWYSAGRMPTQYEGMYKICRLLQVTNVYGLRGRFDLHLHSMLVLSVQASACFMKSSECGLKGRED